MSRGQQIIPGQSLIALTLRQCGAYLLLVPTSGQSCRPLSARSGLTGSCYWEGQVDIEADTLLAHSNLILLTFGVFLSKSIKIE